jgi:hypothetical protein
MHLSFYINIYTYTVTLDLHQILKGRFELTLKDEAKTMSESDFYIAI